MLKWLAEPSKYSLEYFEQPVPVAPQVIKEKSHVLHNQNYKRIRVASWLFSVEREACIPLALGICNKLKPAGLLSPGLYLLLVAICLNACSARFCISSGLMSSICVAIDHTQPYGSTTVPYLSPQNILSSGIFTVQPAFTA